MPWQKSIKFDMYLEAISVGKMRLDIVELPLKRFSARKTIYRLLNTETSISIYRKPHVKTHIAPVRCNNSRIP